MKLSEKKCEACLGNVVKLSEDEIDNLLKEIDSWKILEDKKWLFKEYKLKDFAQTLEFVNKVAEVAEEEFHHPNFEFTWGKCKILIQTHKVDGLCEVDFVLAAKIDEIS